MYNILLCDCEHKHKRIIYLFMRYRKIPNESIRRLPVYLRGLLYFAETGAKGVSSEKLADFLHFNPAQIRKDFSYFGYFGIRGVGYDVNTLIKQTRSILKLDNKHKTALIGAGNLGKAILAYPGFGVYGFEILAVFDSDPAKIGKKISGRTIEDVSNLRALKKRGISLGIVATPAPAAQQVADALVDAGITGILNFAPHHLNVPKKVKVITIDIAMELGRLPYYA